jgi:hypothetical protein
MQYLESFEKILLKSGLDFSSNKVIDDFFLTGKPDAVRDLYRCCQGDIAELMVSKAEMNDELSILEPGAGKGAILKKISNYKDHAYCEINISFVVHHLSEISKNFICTDFFDLSQKFDRIIINPPFSFKQYVAHIFHAYELLNVNGVLVFLYPKNAEYLKIGNGEFIEFLERAEKTEVGKVCGECECVIGKIIKL